ncbi:unnamed protein product [Bursaphelenchus xylophilus]|uniref:(pine wood nematode) hypothetical protein n=1 Tax=Bursaphelenchus xylophilus TaxID=6326 RepID=A0A1I7S342_BURXY|nr:unnamed protein product [Bursaphelenchus xylophilus]CAG9116088.1 unnamed protein product [Bursaphelenchus xylophilus]
MELVKYLETVGNHVLESLENERELLAAFKGLRNGLVYGTRIRAPHALVMVFLFGKGPLLSRLKTILTLTKTHAFNLGRFVFGYKLLLALLRKLEGDKNQFHSFISAFAVGYLVFGKENGVNTQINLYLLSRIVYGMAKLGAEKGFIPTPNFPVFPWFAAVVWGTVLWMFEYHQHVLQNSLQSSMTYLYHDSDFWTGIRNFLFVNK